MRAADRVIGTLYDLFDALGAQERERLAEGSRRSTPQQRSVVNPNPLREALGTLPGSLFQVGEWGRLERFIAYPPAMSTRVVLLITKQT